MFEVIILFVIMFLVAACAFFPVGGSMLFFSKLQQPAGGGQPAAPVKAKQQSSSEAFNFLTHLKSEIEADLFPRPTDSVLRRHYDALVAVELENRLALMAE
ncbi:hypothetical protein IVG45_07440 [Methylomonas sp. LL1]|uniref:hypothetical protein n=1 Tax=Methylomonas sp. LL1 TaxID=2785785 RepID=UPI0018C387E3|nr:hypothetical protein [Methylomonas sp. LL1]QPK64772.1 hypothetical protein IVG45_07440 [Methylomonas sp. LL1]